MHYFQASIRGLSNGTLLRTGTRFLSYRRLERAVEARYGLVVQAGPFKGMKYVPIIPNHALIPKLLGIYEQELHPCLAGILERGYDVVVDVGSAEGYYVVGLARLLPRALIHGFDIELRERQLCRAMAAANGVAERVTVEGRCDPAVLQSLIERRTLVIVDIEGAEIELLDLARAPKLAAADLLVEIHDHDRTARIGNAIQAHFAGTHELTVIPSAPRRAEDHPLVAFLPAAEDRQLAVMEREGPQEWFFLRSRAGR